MSNMLEQLAQFHFSHPLWLLALIPLTFIYWLMVHKKASGSEWNKVIDAHLLPVLLKVNSNPLGKSFSVLLMIAWLISVLALANPVWEKRAVPVFQTTMARVIVLDLSRSMNIADVKPSRLARAKFKIEDILAKNEEGQMGLVVFAGDAFTVTPLTRDADTISSLLSSLTPSMMPVQGSRADLGLLKAQELLQQAGMQQGQVLLIADGGEEDSALAATAELSKRGYVVSVLSVGTAQGGAIPNVTGQDRKPIVIPLQEKILKKMAKKGGGRYSPLRSNNADIDYLLTASTKMNANKTERADDVNNQDWKSQGPMLILLLLPLAALAFRRGWLLSVGLVVMVVGQPQPVMAASIWDNLWTRQDQQADQALQKGDFEQAHQLAKNPLRRGSAAFKKGDYEQALNDFSTAASAENSADAAYNKGNTLAQLKRYEDAIKAYDEALKQQAGMQDAIDNKAKIEELLKQQKQQEKQNEQQKDQQQKQNEQQKNQDQQEDSKSAQGGEKDTEQEQQKEGEKQDKDEGSDKDKNNKEQQEKENQFAKANKEKEQNDDETLEQQEANTAQAEEEKVEEEKAEQEKAAKDQNKKEKSQAQIEAEALSKEEKIAAEQWLRRIPDNPGELLKRKFKYQYKQRRHSSNSANGVPW